MGSHSMSTLWALTLCPPYGLSLHVHLMGPDIRYVGTSSFQNEWQAIGKAYPDSLTPRNTYIRRRGWRFSANDRSRIPHG